jgi:hypothetical protein
MLGVSGSCCLSVGKKSVLEVEKRREGRTGNKGIRKDLIGLDVWGRVQGDFSLSENLGVQVIDISS